MVRSRLCSNSELTFDIRRYMLDKLYKLIHTGLEMIFCVVPNDNGDWEMKLVKNLVEFEAEEEKGEMMKEDCVEDWEMKEGGQGGVRS